MGTQARQLDDNLWYDGRFLRRGVMPVSDPVKRDATTIYRDAFAGMLGHAPLPSPVSNAPAYYASNAAVFSAVNALAWRVAQANIELMQRQDTEYKETPDHEAMRLLANPNPYQTRLHLMWHVVADMKLNGNAYWFLAGPNRGAPREIWRLYPRHVALVRGRQEYIKGYVYSVDGNEIPLDVSEVIHFANPNPFDWYGYGFPDLQVASLPADTAQRMAEWNRSLFGESNAVPAGVLSIADWISDEDFERLKTDWRRSYGGSERKTAFLRGGKVEFQSIGLNQTDMEFNTGQRYTAEEIYTIFGTQHLLPGQSAEDRKANERIFLEGYVQPLLDYICEVLSDQLITFWDKPGVYTFEPEDVSPRDKALEMEATRLRRPLLTLNEARADIDLDALPGGDDVMATRVEQGIAVAFEIDAVKPPGETTAPDVPADSGGGVADGTVPENIAADQGLNGAQIMAAQTLATSVSTGELPAVVAQELLLALGIQADRVDRMIQAAVAFAGQGQQAPAMPDSSPQAVPPIPAAPAPNDTPPADTSPDNSAQTADENAAEREGSGSDTGEDIGEFANRSLPASVLPAIADELRAWRTYAARRVGQGDARPFAPEVTPPFLTAHITDRLSVCGTSEQVKAVFVEMLDAVYDSAVPADTAYAGDGVPPDLVQAKALLGNTDHYYARHYGDDTAYAGRALKVYSLTAANYRAALLQIVGQAVDRESIRQTGQPAIDKATFRRNGRAAIDIHFQAAFTDGLADGGVVTFDLDAEETATITAQVDAEQGYWSAFSDEVYSAIVPLVRELAAVEDDLTLSGLSEPERATLRQQAGDLTRRIIAKTAEFTRRVDVWVNKGLNRIYELGKLSAKSNQMLQWLLGPTEEHCPTCSRAHGQRHRAREWVRSGIMPQSDALLCGGFQCKCELIPTIEAASGRLARIPRKDWSTAQLVNEAIAVKAETGALPAWAKADGDTVIILEHEHDHEHDSE